MYLPHLIHESSRMKGSQWQNFMLPHYVPTQTSLSKGPEARSSQVQPQAGWHTFCHHLSCISLPSLCPGCLPAPNHPKSTCDWWLHSSTLFHHNPQAPLNTNYVYRIRACGFTTKTQQEDTLFSWTIAPGELGLEELSESGWGWPLVVMPWRSWCVWAMLGAVVPVVGAGGGQNRLGADLAACTRPNELMVKSDTLSQSLKIRARNQKQWKWQNWGQWREVMRGGDCAAEWLSYVLC